MNAALDMMRQAAALRLAWHNLDDLSSSRATTLLRAWLNLENRAARAMMESLHPIGWTW